MARRTLSQLSCKVLIFGLIVISLGDPFLSASEAFQSSDSRRRPMILPLYLSPPASSSHHHHRRPFDGRRLQKSDPPHLPNARMRLHDDLLANGYYTTRLYIGTPPQEFALIVDTGSTVTYVPCSDCKQCGKHQDPRFQPNSSSTYQPIKCSINCNCDNEGVQCTYERRYAEMSSSSGVLGEDIVSFGNESELVPQRAVFGCETLETGDLYSQRADGIMGLGRGRLSVMDQLVDKRVIDDSFSLCYGGMGVGGGAMVLGAIPSPPGMVFTHSDPFRSPYYNIELKEIHVAGKPLKLSPKVFDQRHGTVLDSGTTYAYLPEEAFLAFKDALIKKIHFLKRVHGPDPNYNDICFSGAGRDVTQLSKIFPEVDMVFNNGQKWSLSPENYLFRHTKVSGAYCLGIFKNADSTTLLGGILVRNTLVTYDRENDKIGFWKTNCSELGKRLNYVSAPSPSRLPSDSQNRSTEILPPVVPVDLSQNVFPGRIQIGLITFDMILGFNNSMKPNFTELTEFIAHELEVKVSQVHLMNFTNEGNNSLIIGLQLETLIY
ncbi:aspartic proteinase 36-like isoform X3 [Ziziphus jujuba]|uniref:Aspartic proteinase 36-like isoform X3 n=1 Tax=Ziziphus jujuba TaxID=326968 RepID=A0ABM4A937_ZIZJJ|nr:aspartic proteinase 36-like isoform X3 [Ziziphus jujuba]